MPPEHAAGNGAPRARFRAGLRAVAFASALALAPFGACTSAPGGPVVEIATDGGATVRVPVELARTREELSRGLMWRDDLASDAGMLFVFDHDAERTFWMKNTPLPLDIIFIDAGGKVVSVASTTTPFSTAPIRSSGAARYVLEVNAGFASRHGVRAGSALRLPDLGK